MFVVDDYAESELNSTNESITSSPHTFKKSLSKATGKMKKILIVYVLILALLTMPMFSPIYSTWSQIKLLNWRWVVEWRAFRMHCRKINHTVKPFEFLLSAGKAPPNIAVGPLCVLLV